MPWNGERFGVLEAFMRSLKPQTTIALVVAVGRGARKRMDHHHIKPYVTFEPSMGTKVLQFSRLKNFRQATFFGCLCRFFVVEVGLSGWMPVMKATTQRCWNALNKCPQLLPLMFEIKIKAKNWHTRAKIMQQLWPQLQKQARIEVSYRKEEIWK